MRVILFFCIFVVLMATPAFACTCVSPPPEVKTAHDLGQWYADRSEAIFEGTVKRVALNWVFRDAKVGDLVPADLDQDEPSLQVTFDISRFYKGVEQNDSSLTTGIGGGDCGFDFETGKQYLVYAFVDSSGHLSTGICSGTGLLEGRQPELSYLRGERVASETPKQNTGISSTKLCGRVTSTAVDLAESQLFLFRIDNESPIPTEETEVAHDGSFCFMGARPGSYYLAFMNRDGDSPTSFVFFPGTTKSSDARRVEVKSGQTHSDLTFIVQPEAAVSVSGTVLVRDKSVLPAGCKVLLLSVDPLSVLVAYAKDVEPSGSFELPHVLPGKYWAFVGVDDSDVAPRWLTRKAEVDVNAPVTSLSLELVRKPGTDRKFTPF